MATECWLPGTEEWENGTGNRVQTSSRKFLVENFKEKWKEMIL